VFTSGATESNNLAIKGVAFALRGDGDHIITTMVEHKSVLAACADLEGVGFNVSYLPVGSDGRVDPENVEHAITPHTTLVSIMHANNEIGVLQPLQQISAITRRHRVLLHTDTAQSIASVPFDVQELGVDLASLSAHKFYGPKGVGALFIRRDGPHVPVVAQIADGNQEQGLRSGTLNVPGIVGLGRAASLMDQERNILARRVLKLREHLRTGLLASLEGVQVNGSLCHRVPGNLNVSFSGIDAQDLITLLPDVALSEGSACSSGQAAPSHVLTALGLKRAEAREAVRISIGRFNTESDIQVALASIVSAVRRLRSM